MKEQLLVNGREASGNIVDPVKRKVTTTPGDPEPSRHVRRLHAPHMRFGGDHDVSIAQGPADQYNIQLNFSLQRQRLWAKEKHSRRADVPGHERYGIVLKHPANTPELQRQPQGRPWA